MKREDIHIADLVPHAGSMVLLDEVVDYGPDHIHCRAAIDPAASHPLAEHLRLPATALAEYGAQAMAVHGGLLTEPGTPPRPGRLVALRQLDLAVDGLDRAVEVDVFGYRLGGDDSGHLYTFEVRHHQTLLASGKATVMFVADGADF
jgi:predicted hotdog family 3-hydroxylacyl-ACP dehydratase